METTNHPDAAAAARAGSTDAKIVTFAVSDPEVLLALSEYTEGPARTNFLVTSLKVGVLALKAARGTLDSDTLRREGDRVMEELGTRLNTWRSAFEQRVTGSLEQYFDPSTGMFTERVNRLTRPDGDLAVVVRQQVSDAQTNLTRVFEQFIGENSQLFRMLDPGNDNQLVMSLQRSLESVVQAQNQSILGQFSLDNKESALVRFLGELTARHGDLNSALSRNMQEVVAEFSLDREDSALSRLVARVEAAQKSVTSELSLDNEDSALFRIHRLLAHNQEAVLRNQLELAARLDTAIQTLSARRAEAEKSTRHGFEFEETLGDHLRLLARAGGDIVQDTGSSTGLKPNCKVGDHVITIGPEKLAAGARIVIEAKESASYDLARTLEEADVARLNRQADVCIFVHSTRTAQAGIPNFQRFGMDIVVQWNAEDDANDVWLQAALMVATALSVKAKTHDKQDAASFGKIDKAIERVRKALEGFDEINTSANTARSAVEKILSRARIMQEGLSSQVQAIVDEMVKLKDAASEI